jgi:NADH-quinone oxidoreductase subunit H
VPITPTWGVADLDIGILFFLAMAGLVGLRGDVRRLVEQQQILAARRLRSAAQTVSYEVFMGCR